MNERIHSIHIFIQFPNAKILDLKIFINFKISYLAVDTILFGLIHSDNYFIYLYYHPFFLKDNFFM